ASRRWSTARARTRIRPARKTSSAGCATTTASTWSRARTWSRGGGPLSQAADPRLRGVLRRHEVTRHLDLAGGQLADDRLELAREMALHARRDLLTRQRREPRQRRHRLLRAADAARGQALPPDADQAR